MHPYEMASILRARGKDRDMPIKWGSLYTVVRNMERHGLLEVVGSTRHGGRPERTIYRITDAGRAELDDWTRELISTPDREGRSFEIGLSVMGALAPDEAANLLGRRLGLLDEQVARERESLARGLRDVPRLFLVESEYRVALLEAEAAWLRRLVDELTTGSFPGIAQWRAWRATGEVPPELADLAERGSTDDQMEEEP